MDVHSIETREADCDEQLSFKGRSNGLLPECTTGGSQSRAIGQLQRERQDRRRVGAPLSRRRDGWPARPQFASAPAAPAYRTRSGRTRRNASPPALDGLPDRADHVPGAGWEYVHVAIDDHSRIAFSATYPDEKRELVIAFLHAALAYYARLGIHFKVILTDNGPAYRSYRLAKDHRELGLKHRFTRRYTPRTNGKAERFIQTALREWAYARTYQNSNQRHQELRSWLHLYNWYRPHARLGFASPISRSGLDRNNLLSHHT